MFEYIKGILQEKQPQKAIIETNGIAYKILIPLSTYAKLPEVNSPLTLYLSHIVREDSQTLYGFYEKSERDLFETLITVSGIGPKTALGMIGHMSLENLQQAIASSNIQMLSKLPGIGKKTAERLILEMKDKIRSNFSTKDLPMSLTLHDSIVRDAIAALMNLGYNPKDAQNAVEGAKSKNPNETDLGMMITLALRQI